LTKRKLFQSVKLSKQTKNAPIYILRVQ